MGIQRPTQGPQRGRLHQIPARSSLAGSAPLRFLAPSPPNSSEPPSPLLGSVVMAGGSELETGGKERGQDQCEVHGEKLSVYSRTCRKCICYQCTPKEAHNTQ